MSGTTALKGDVCYKEPASFNSTEGNQNEERMRCVIRILGFANGADCTFANQFVERFEFGGHDGLGMGYYTTDVKAARQFNSKSEAFAFLRTQSTTHPLRDDGEPNRPLTGATVSIEPISSDAVQ